MGGFCETRAGLLPLGAYRDGLVGVHKRGPHGGLRSCGRSEGGPGLGSIVRGLFVGFGLLLLEGALRRHDTGFSAPLFARVLTGHIEGNEFHTETGDNDLVQTFVSGREKEVRSADTA
jgi:hypothetical protein